ncbi:MAG: hypothetical protein N3B11_06035 [Coriobacteriia bacterium]|nr:hypothetical protein [Coriobacteriia bacterium]
MMATMSQRMFGASASKPLAIRHACGHEHVHIMPAAIVDAAPSLLGLAEAIAAHECPACVAGLPRWVADPHGVARECLTAGVC